MNQTGNDNEMIECRKKEIKTIVNLTNSLLESYSKSIQTIQEYIIFLKNMTMYLDSEENTLRMAASILNRLANLVGTDVFLNNATIRSSTIEMMPSSIEYITKSCDQLKNNNEKCRNIVRMVDAFVQSTKVLAAQIQIVQPALQKIMDKVSE